MRVRVLYFAALRERVGVPEEELEAPEGTRVEGLLELLRERHEGLRGLQGFRVAINQRFSTLEAEVPAEAEVALIPPVAGGAGDWVALVRAPILPDALQRAVEHPGAGAQALFLGVVRDHHAGREVARMDYEAYEAMAEAELGRIAERLREGHPEVLRLALVHRFGRLEIGEASVGIAVASAHRKAAFRACEWAIDAVKETVPIWKLEHYADGERSWVRADEMGVGEPAAPPPGARDG